MTSCIAYKNGYKYQLKQDYSLRIDIAPPEPIVTPYVELHSDGLLKLKSGYAWDGPSGPTVDTPSFMRGSLVHDALYQLMRERHLDHRIYRNRADQCLRKICLEDGMLHLRAWAVYYAVHWFADPAADPANERPLTFAPQGCQSA